MHMQPNLECKIFIPALLILFILLTGCANKKSPVSPLDDPDPGITERQTDEDTFGNNVLWGIWDVSLNESGEFEIIPQRGAFYTVNVNQYLQPPYGSLANMNVVIVDETTLMINGRVVIDVTLTHPFPDYDEYCGFDVLGVFIHNGSETAKYSSLIKYAKSPQNAVVNNADGYTRWMNPNEFPVSGLGGYTEGALGAKNVNWTATINPYKYFCNGLAATESITSHYSTLVSVQNRGVFRAGSSNSRRYDLTFPMSGGYPQADFQYAVVASWVEPSPVPPQDIPEDWPNNANITESFYVTGDTTGSTAYWNTSSDKGGNLLLTLEIFDQGARIDPASVEGQISDIIVESPSSFIPAPGNNITFTSSSWTTQPGTTDISQKFVLDCGAVNPQGPSPRDNRIMVTIQSDIGTYDPGVGTAHPAGRPRLHQVLKVAMVPWSGGPPDNVTNFQASDGLLTLGSHSVELTWDEVPGADDYTLQRSDYNTGSETWGWVAVSTIHAGSTSYTDSGARYCGSNNPIDYRLRAVNSEGNSPSWSTDTGYPKMRRVGITFLCAADNGSGANAVVPWSTAISDFIDCNSFWNDYGFEFVMENSGSFFWVTEPQFRDLTGTEYDSMHAIYWNKPSHSGYINAYYVRSYNGNYGAAFCIALCPGSFHNTQNTFIIQCQDTRDPWYDCPSEYQILLAHECGHALTRYFDIYELDTNGNGYRNSTCTAENTWCNGPPPYTPVMYCDEDAAYPEGPGAQYATPKNLMWYSYCSSVSDYDLTVGQYIYASEWVRDNEGSYPLH